jgi:hypothetical protein
MLNIEGEEKMKGNPVLYKSLVVGVIVLFIGMIVFPSMLASPQDDIKIYIYAGFFRYTRGRFGIGFGFDVKNQGNENISGHFQIDFYKLSGDLINREEGTYNLEPSHGYSYGSIDNEFPPINYLKITVEAGGYNISRSGVEIGPFVLLLN